MAAVYCCIVQCWFVCCSAPVCPLCVGVHQWWGLCLQANNNNGCEGFSHAVWRLNSTKEAFQSKQKHSFINLTNQSVTVSQSVSPAVLRYCGAQPGNCAASWRQLRPAVCVLSLVHPGQQLPNNSYYYLTVIIKTVVMTVCWQQT